MTQRTTLAALRRSAALVALAFLACSDGNSGEEPSSSSGNSLLLNFTSDYTTGELRWMNADSTSLSAGALSFDQDSKVFANGKDVFVLDRTSSNISCMQADKIGDPSLIAQKALEQGANPQEVAVAGNKGYIVFNSEDYVQAFDVSTCVPGEKIVLPISEANAASIKISGDTLLVLSQRLEAWSATKPGLLIRINATTKALIDTIQLKFYNPSSAVLSNGKLYVSSQGAYNEDYSINTEVSGIEAVDLNTGISEVIATGTLLGGGGGSIALDEGKQLLYAGVSISWGDNPVKPVDLKTNTVGSALPNITDAGGGLVFDKETGKLFVGDRGASPGIKVYDTATGTTTPVSGGDLLLLPYSLAIARW